MGRHSLHRLETTPETGLTEAQARQRLEAGLDNRSNAAPTKTAGRIIAENTCTLFNFVNAMLAAAIIAVGSYKNLLFMGVILCNTAIGIIQELRAKRTVDKLSLIASAKARVVREGKIRSLPLEEVVLGDLLDLSSGSQVAADSLLLTGECDVSEAFVTGESDAVHKQPGDFLLAGSFLVSGACRARAEKVGLDTYIASISKGAKQLKGAASEIMGTLKKIIQVISIVIIPVGALLLYNQASTGGNAFHEAVVQTAAALIGMIPEGLMLLTSTVLAVGVVRLSYRRVLVQDLYCIEALARVDTLCLDKTGTITQGSMEVTRVIPLEGNTEVMISEALAALFAALPDRNATANALAESFPQDPGWSLIKAVPFSSQAKWSGASFRGKGTFVLGAPFFVCPKLKLEQEQQIKGLEADYRVLLLARSSDSFAGRCLPESLLPMALVLVRDKIRPQAVETLQYFAEQGVDLKVISGDSPITVSGIAKRAGIAGYGSYVDASALKTNEELASAAEKYTVFGRVLPGQKKQLIAALQQRGHTVAMTGDGVNDVLALKQADCSIAMAAGSDAARNVSQLVLLDSSFDAMPQVVAEGRRSINNIQRSATLFLVKTMYSAFLALLFLFLRIPYPFMPIQLTLISVCTIGIPSFILALEPNKERIKGRFLQNILARSVPGALSIITGIVLCILALQIFGFTQEQYTSMCVISTGFCGLVLLLRLCLPLNWIRGILWLGMCLLFAGALLFLRPLFSLALLPWSAVCCLLVILAVCAAVFCISYRLCRMHLFRD